LLRIIRIIQKEKQHGSSEMAEAVLYAGVCGVSWRLERAGVLTWLLGGDCERNIRLRRSGGVWRVESGVDGVRIGCPRCLRYVSDAEPRGTCALHVRTHETLRAACDPLELSNRVAGARGRTAVPHSRRPGHVLFDQTVPIIMTVEPRRVRVRVVTTLSLPPAALATHASSPPRPPF